MKAILLPRTFIQVIWLLIFFLIFGLYVERAINSYGYDVKAYEKAAHAIITGSELYTRDKPPFKYLPQIALLFSPIGFMNFQFIKFLFAALGFTSFLYIYRFVIREIGPIRALLVFLFLARFHNHEISYLQVNHLILALLLIAWEKFKKSPQSFVGGLAFSLGASFKVTPLALLSLFLPKRNRKALYFYTGSFFVLCFAALFFFGEFTIFSQWTHQIQRTSAYPASLNPHVQSMGSLIWSFSKDTLPPHYLRPIIAAFLFLFLFLSLIPYYVTQWRKQDWEITAWTASAILVIVTIFSPLAWFYTYVLTLPAWVCLMKKRKYLPVICAFILMTLAPLLARMANFPHLVHKAYLVPIGGLVLMSFLIFSSWKRAFGQRVI